MARNLQLALTLFAKDTASKVLRKTMQDTINQSKSVEKADAQLGKSQKQNADTAIRSSKSLLSEWQRASSARSTLGIRSERDIQREIQLTQAAYNRLARTGTLSANEQSRAFAAMSDRIGRLRGELTSASQSLSRFERAKGMGSNMMSIAGGVTAAGAVLAQPVGRQMSYDKTLAYMANTGFNDLSPEGRIKKKGELDNAIREAVKYGGGTKDQGADTLNTILAGGQVDSQTAMDILPSIMRYASASGANPNDLAKMGSAAIGLFDIKKEQLPTFFDKAIRSGENGNFELADMAGKLPTQMSKAKSLGMSGLDDVDKLLAYNQANALTAGDNDSAATNVNNLFDKITSSDIKNSMKNYRFRNKSGEVENYEQFLVSQRSQGVNTADAFMKAVTGIVSNNKEYKKLKVKLQESKGTDKEADIAAALDVLVSSITSNIIADQQASMALKTNILKKDFIDEQIKGTKSAAGAGEDAFAVIADTPDFKAEQLKNVRDFSEMDSIKPLSDILGRLSSDLTSYAEKYPSLTVAVSGATTGIKAMGAAAVAFAGLRFLSGGGGVPGTGSGGISAPGTLGKMAGNSIAVPLLYITAGSVAISSVRDALREDFAKKDMAGKVDSISTGTSGYSFVDLALSVVKDRFSKKGSSISVPSNITTADVNPFNAQANNLAGFGVPSYLAAGQQGQKNQPIQVTTKLEVDGRVLAEVVNDVNGTQAVRGPTGSPQ
ncbi:phage tail tape measure protein [Yersinia frederiksenii]|uniref:phage tail tape measure protein n=1 Tax=Yersinia frederiksenii TaxID=29484 RepID=UPI0025AA6498|nr:phage tail tape measure protein [Yersinia frederiksenii]MDN0117585.1 phage tail tape measure protein [Yersinia frederiksenii]